MFVYFPSLFFINWQEAKVWVQIFRLMKWDDYFHVDFDHFQIEGHS